MVKGTSNYIKSGAIFIASIVMIACSQILAIGRDDRLNIYADEAIDIFQKPNSPHFITIFNLDRGSIINLTGDYTQAPTGKVNHRSMRQFWQQGESKCQQRGQKLRSVINGAFFATYRNKGATGIAFGLKQDGKIISYGYGLNEFPGLNRTFAWNNSTHTATIGNYQRETFDRPNYPDVVGALAATAGKRAQRPLGRTFIGLKDDRTVLVFSSTAATQADATSTLVAYGAKQVTMMDGGGSTGLVVNGTTKIDSGTAVPHAIGFCTPGA